MPQKVLSRRSQLCISIGATNLNDLSLQVKQATQWADLIEIRLDKLTRIDFDTLKIIAQSTILPVIWTIRKESQGGAFRGPEEERLNLLHRLIQHLQPAYVDLEAEMGHAVIKALQQLSSKTKWIISAHLHQETPIDLNSIYEQLIQYNADIYKLVTFAQKTTDALRMLNFVKMHNQKEQKLCGICMGEMGHSTRILGPVVGNPIVYASLNAESQTASGQLTAEELVNTYRFNELNLQTQILGLIGNPIHKSYSHITHNAVLKKLAINASYLKFHLDESELDLFFKEIRLLPIKGLSVTMPFKEKVLHWIEMPHQLLACNTLSWTPQGLQGYNTDGIGALKALKADSLRGKKMVILGAGGTAKAIALAAHKEGAQILILNRTVESAKKIAEPLNASWGSLEALASISSKECDFLMQATSVGMLSDVNATPVPSEWIPANVCVLDVISKPSGTQFLHEAQKKGCHTIRGTALFIHQAVEQFVCWFGQDIPQQNVEQTIQSRISIPIPLKSVVIQKSQLNGALYLPSSKSHSIRAILLAAFAKGTSHIRHVLNSPDCTAAINAAKQFGAKVDALTKEELAITGVAGYPQIPNQVIDAGNSGLVLRFAAALATLSSGYTVITGDEATRRNRPVQPLIGGLTGLQAWAVSTRQNGYAPLVVKGPIQSGMTRLSGEDSQPVSALLLTAAFVPGETTVQVDHAGEKPWLAVTLSWLDRLGVSYTHHNLESFVIWGQRIRPCFDYSVPGDLSSLAFPLIAAVITKSELTIHHVDVTDVQGDKEIIFLLQRMGAKISVEPSNKLIKVFHTSHLKGQIIDVNGLIDAVPILAVLGCFIEGETQLVNAAIARQKESNRLACIAEELKKMGAQIEETEDGLKIAPSPLQGTIVNSHGDHRLAMSLIVAGLAAKGKTIVQDIECINKSYPHFLNELIKLGAHLHEEVR